MTDTTTSTPSTADLARQAADTLAELTGVERHDIALVLGSGWLPAVDALGEATAEIDTTDLPGFHAAGVVGHSGKIRSLRGSTGRRVLVFLRRTHFYEGKGVAAVVHPVRTAAAAGCRAIVLTNGCGGLKETLAARPAGADLRPHQPHRRPARSRAPTSSTSPTSTARGCVACAARSTRASTRASTCSSPARTTRPRPRSAWSAPSAATWWACRPPSRRSPPARPAWRCSASAWSPTSPPGSAASPSTTRRSSKRAGRPRRRMGDLLGQIVPRI